MGDSHKLCRKLFRQSCKGRCINVNVDGVGGIESDGLENEIEMPPSRRRNSLLTSKD